MRNFLYRLMMGRYGSDRLNKHLLILSIVLTIANVFVKSVIIYVFVYILLLYVLFRMLSKNINKRYQENQRHEQSIAPIMKRVSVIKKSSKDKGHKYYICPTCKQIVRVPKGKGRIDIRCPRCSTVFEKRT